MERNRTQWNAHRMDGRLPYPLEFPFDNDFSEVNGKFPLLNGGIGRETQALNGRHHVLDQVLSDRVVNSMVTTQQLSAHTHMQKINFHQIFQMACIARLDITRPRIFTQHKYLQHVYELGDRVTFLYNDLLGPVDEGGISVLHPDGNHRGQDVQGLTDNRSGLHCMCFQQTAIYTSHVIIV